MYSFNLAKFSISTCKRVIFLTKKWGLLQVFQLLHFFTFRSSRPEIFCKKGVLRNFAKFTRKHLCESLFFNNVAYLSLQLYLKKRLWHRCFPVNCAKFLRTPFLRKHIWWLLRYFEKYCPLRYIAQRYHLLYFKFIAYFLRTLVSWCTSCW